MEQNGVIQSLIVKLIENMPAIVVLIIVAWNQQQQINHLVEVCIINASK